MDIGVFAYIKNSEGKILFVKDATRQERWTLPGGGVGFGELVTESLIREVREEAQIEVAPQRILGIFSKQKTPGIVILFEATHISGTPAPDGKETGECAFFSLEELLEMRDQVKPAQLSMVYQVARAPAFPLFNSFPRPQS